MKRNNASLKSLGYLFTFASTFNAGCSDESISSPPPTSKTYTGKVIEESRESTEYCRYTFTMKGQDDNKYTSFLCDTGLNDVSQLDGKIRIGSTVVVNLENLSQTTSEFERQHRNESYTGITPKDVAILYDTLSTTLPAEKQ